MRAWHAGTAYWGGRADINSAAIGIELDNNGDEAFAGAQIVMLIALLDDLRERYKIPTANFLGHGDVAPRRKVDPSHLFPWQRLADRGFGLWCEAPAAAGPTGVDSATLLQAFGYDVSDLPAAISAFRRHFGGDGQPHRNAATSDLNNSERAQLQCLVARKRE